MKEIKFSGETVLVLCGSISFTAGCFGHGWGAFGLVWMLIIVRSLME